MRTDFEGCFDATAAKYEESDGRSILRNVAYIGGRYGHCGCAECRSDVRVGSRPFRLWSNSSTRYRLGFDDYQTRGPSVETLIPCLEMLSDLTGSGGKTRPGPPAC